MTLPDAQQLEASNRRLLQAWMPTWTRNAAANYGRIQPVETLQELHKTASGPLVIAGSGPSLDRNLEDLAGVIDFCRREGLQRLVIGNGTNILFSDEGYRGIVIDLSQTFSHLSCKGNAVVAGAGISCTTASKV